MPKSTRRKRVPIQPPPTAAKQARITPRLATDKQRTLSWRFSTADLDGPWGWRSVGIDKLHWIISKLRDFERMSLNEVFHQGDEPGKKYEVSQLSPLAIKRLQQLELDDVDTVYRLRVSGKPRIYGLLIGDVFHLLWWDPEHKVCPSKLRHT